MSAGRSRLAQARAAHGYTQEKFADALGVTRLTVQRWEHGQFSPRPEMRAKMAALLKVTAAEASTWFGDRERPHVISPAHAEVPDVPQELTELRAAVFGGGPQQAPVDLGKLVNRAHQLYQHADYDGATRVLTNLIPRFNSQQAGAGQRAAGYIAAAKLATKLGDTHLAWVAADRAHQAAREGGSPALVGVARYQVAAALHRSGDVDQARAVAADASDDLARTRAVEPQHLSARGSLLLLSAVLSARLDEPGAARASLAEARELAGELGADGNHLWTGFGPTNVVIHELSVAVESGAHDRVRALGDTIDTDLMPTGLVSRRAQVHLDLGRAAASTNTDALAVLHLLEAERVATQSVSRNVVARQLIATLVSREQRSATPGLRALARRVGVIHG